MRYYTEECEEVLQALDTCPKGLSADEASRRLEENGRNVLEAPPGESLVKKFLEQLVDPMILILLAAALVSGVLAVVQDESFVDVIIILAVVLINAVLGVYQENKAEKAIEALQEMSAATCRVMRGGHLIVLPTEELTVGDIVHLEAGDAVPADGRLIECASFTTEEAALTGESLPVDKRTEAIALPEGHPETSLGDRRNMVYSGSSVVNGRGVMVVTATGMQTEMGKIAGALAEAKEGKTPLQIKLTQLSKILTWLVLLVCILVFLLQVLRAGRLTLEGTLDSFMVAVSLAVAAIPEGLAAVVTVVLSIGVTNMSKRNAIIRRLTAVETLGCAQIICTDKTGTLTQNRMTVVECYGDEEAHIAEAMSLCTDAEADEDGNVTGEPTEAALVAWAFKLGLKKYEEKEAFPRIGEAPFDSIRKMMTTVHRCPEGTVQYTKGAPDVVIRLCTHYRRNGQVLPIDEDEMRRILEANRTMAEKALRVLACAEVRRPQAPESYDAASLEQGLCFVGLCGMIDPVRPEVLPAMQECRGAGIRPIMITGDHVDTASAIAKELGILREGQKAVTGTELSAMDDEEFEKNFRRISVYARVQPEHKTRIVNAWQRAGFVTAMTGDGVNDAPSIKKADIGVGMGITGTDVTKNVADMVLADDNFATIVHAVEEGRRIYDNIRKCIQFLLSSNMSEVLSIFLATLLGFTILKPVQLLWINLITDSLPALALGMEKAEPDIMKRAPRDARAGIFSGGMGADILYQSVFVTILVLLSFAFGHYLQYGEVGLTNSIHGTTMAFLTLNLAEVFHSINMRSQRQSIFRLHTHNPMMVLSSVLAVLLTVVVTKVPVFARAFGLTDVGLREYAIAVVLGLCIIPLVEIGKWIRRRTSDA